MAPDDAAAVLRRSLAGHEGDATVADAAAKSGLALRDAELGLHRLLQVHRGHLAVTDKGQLLFRFPDGFAIDHERRAKLRMALRRIGRAGVGLARWVVRVGLAVFLVGYAAVFGVALLVAAIAMSFVAEDSAPLEGLGAVAWGLFDLCIDAVFWSVHPRARLDGGDQRRRPRPFYDRVNRLFFGPPRPPEDPRAPMRMLAAEIRARRGRIGLGDVVRVTGLPRREAEAMLSRLLVDYDGEVDVTDAGAIVYRFGELRPEARTAALPPAAALPAVWDNPVAAEPFTGNTTATNVGIVSLAAFVAAMGALGSWLGLPVWLAQLPLFATLALLAVPVVRAPSWRARRRAIAAENGRRALLAAAHDSATAQLGIADDELAARWRAAAGAPITSTALARILVEMGGEIVIGDDGRALWRFLELELELRTLAHERSIAGDDEREVGAVELSSAPTDEDPAALMRAGAGQR